MIGDLAVLWDHFEFAALPLLDVVAHSRGRGGVFVDSFAPIADHLPLMLLARDAAGIQHRGRLVVTFEFLDDALGLYYESLGLVVLEERLLHDREQLGSTWAHELAHAIDPLRHEVDVDGEQERWAQTLGPLLLEHRPRTVVEALELARAASIRLSVAATHQSFLGVGAPAHVRSSPLASNRVTGLARSPRRGGEVHLTKESS